MIPKAKKRCTLLLMVSMGIPLLDLSAVGAQSVATVRAVEHPEYSRIVLPIERGTEWTLSQGRMEAKLTLTGRAIAYDLGALFDRMPRTRILAVSQQMAEEGSTLSIGLACTCAATVERLGEGVIAIDIRRSNDRQATNNTGSIAPRPVTTDPSTLSEISDVVILAPATLPTVAAAEDQIATPRSPEHVAVGTTQDEFQSQTSPDALASSRIGLLSQLDRAATEGLVTLAPINETVLPRPEDTRQALSVQSPQNLEAPSVEQDLSVMATRLDQHLVVRSARDRTLVPLVESDELEVCQFQDDLSPEYWVADDGDFSASLGERRRHLFTYAGKLDLNALDRLARLYISHGFGREAAQLLRQNGKDLKTAPLLLDLAAIVEDRKADPGGIIAKAENCSGRLSLWHAAAGFADFDLDSRVGEAVRDSLLELPPKMRRLVAVSLSNSALAFENPAAARGVIELLDRTPGEMEPTEVLSRAQLFLYEGRSKAAFELSDKLLLTTSVPATELILTQIKAAISGGGRISERLMSALVFQRHINKGSSLGHELAVAHVQALAASSDFVGALELLRGSDIFTTTTASAIGQDILRQVVESPNLPSELTRTFIANQDLLGNNAESNSIRQAGARRLIDAGLPNAALSVLSQSGMVPTGSVRILAAEALLASGQAQQAVASLQGLGGPEAISVKLEALVRLGEFDQARLLSLEYEAFVPTEVKRLAGLLGDWKNVDSAMNEVLTASDPVIAVDSDLHASTMSQAEFALSNAQIIRRRVQATRVSFEHDKTLGLD